MRNVRNGSFSTETAKADVRTCPLRPESDRLPTNRDVSLRAKLRHKQCSKPFHHSITSSAVASSVGEMVTPSAFAAFRLITRSNLVGCWIGRSPGLAPFRIRST